MQITELESEKLKHQFKITVAGEVLTKRFNQQLDKIAARVRIPGFRPGKTPKNVIMQRYGDDAWEDTRDQVLREAATQINKDHKLRNALDPVVNVISFEKGKDFECTVTFEVLPDIDIKDFKDISLEKLNVTISDADVEKRLESMCADYIRYQEPPNKRGAMKGDLVSVKWSGVLEDGNRMDLPASYQILLGPEKDDAPFAPIVKCLYGKNAGDHFGEKIHFSKNEQTSGLANKHATIQVTVEKIEEPLSFQLDDTFAKEYDHDTLDALRKSVRSSVEFESQKVAHLYTKRNLLDALDAQYSFDLPPTMVENEFKTIWEQLQNEIKEAKAHGELDEEEHNKSEADLRKEYETIAKRRVRLGLLISHLAEAKKLKLTDAEVRSAVVQEAMRYPSQEKEVIKYYANNNQALRNLVAPLLEDKVVDFILKGSKVAEREVDFATLKKIVRGVIPTPYDNEAEEDQQSVEKKSKPKAARKKGQGA